LSQHLQLPLQGYLKLSIGSHAFPLFVRTKKNFCPPSGQKSSALALGDRAVMADFIAFFFKFKTLPYIVKMEKTLSGNSLSTTGLFGQEGD
jgi:hypothetical protein